MPKAKLKEKERAIELRRKGLSYGEILSEVPVTKASLSLWLRDVKLGNDQKKRLIEKGNKGRLMGGEARRAKRIKETREIKDKAIKEVKYLSRRELWLIGAALYWAEGHKERNKGSLVRLGNSDPEMIKLFLKWLMDICKIDKTNIIFRIYLHENSKNKIKEVIRYWANATGFSLDNFTKVTWKENKINTNRKNIGRDYYGLLEVEVRKSINFNRKIQGWIEGISLKK
jgi:hypothetical protein